MRKEPLSRPTFRETFIGRYINQIHVLGLEKRFTPEKKYYFIISTRWTDGSEKIVYRSLQQVNHIFLAIRQILPAVIAKKSDDDLKMIARNSDRAKISLHLKYCRNITRLFATILESESTFINFTLMKHLKSRLNLHRVN